MMFQILTFSFENKVARYLAIVKGVKINKIAKKILPLI